MNGINEHHKWTINGHHKSTAFMEGIAGCNIYKEPARGKWGILNEAIRVYERPLRFDAV
jgi:hypothetical protein